jgi:hypothetical protein
MSQLPETPSNNPPSPIDGPTRTTSPSNPPDKTIEPPHNPITDEKLERLRVLAEERFPHHISDLAVKIPILVTTLNLLLTPEQQMQEPVKSALETGQRYSVFLGDLSETLQILQEHTSYIESRREFAEEYARKLGGMVETWNMWVEKWVEQRELPTSKGEERNKSAVDLVDKLEKAIQDATSGI